MLTGTTTWRLNLILLLGPTTWVRHPVCRRMRNVHCSCFYKVCRLDTVCDQAGGVVSSDGERQFNHRPQGKYTYTSAITRPAQQDSHLVLPKPAADRVALGYSHGDSPTTPYLVGIEMILQRPASGALSGARSLLP
jgi:hypothetical protein